MIFLSMCLCIACLSVHGCYICVYFLCICLCLQSGDKNDERTPVVIFIQQSVTSKKNSIVKLYAPGKSKRCQCAVLDPCVL